MLQPGLMALLPDPLVVAGQPDGAREAQLRATHMRAFDTARQYYQVRCMSIF